MIAPSQPMHLQFSCAVDANRSTRADVHTSQVGPGTGWVWHAVFPAMGTPHPRLLGISHSLQAIEADVHEQLHQVPWAWAEPGTQRRAETSRDMLRATTFEGPFTYRDGRAGHFRAERKSDGAIWTLEVVSAQGDCFESFEFPTDADSIAAARTTDGALSVIRHMLAERYHAPLHAAPESVTASERDAAIIKMAELSTDATAIGEAVMEQNFDEARFLSELLAVNADRAGYLPIALASARLAELLGPLGALPRPGYGAQLVALAETLDAAMDSAARADRLM